MAIEQDEFKYIETYSFKGKLLLDTNHPNAHSKGFKREGYIDSIISSIRKFNF